jgi:hypothetical protein
MVGINVCKNPLVSSSDFCPEDGGGTLFRYVSSYTTNYAALHPRRYNILLLLLLLLGPPLLSCPEVTYTI